MAEEWRAVPGLDPNFEVSNTGKARVKDRLLPYRRHGREDTCVRRGHELVQQVNRYVTVSFAGRSRLLHRLVLTAFKGPPPTPEAQCRHLDGVKTHNWVENLEWGTPTENQYDRFTHGTACEGEKNYRAILTERKVLRIMELRGKISPTRIGEIVDCETHLVKHVVYGQAWNWLTGLPRARHKPQ